MIKDYNELISSKEFKNWIKKHKDAYLSSCVLINDPGIKDLWHFDFYLPKTNKITTFILGEEIKINENQKIFEQKQSKLKKIDLGNIIFNLEDVYNLINKEFKGKLILKKIIILQDIDILLWNISLLTNDFNLTNIKLDARNGKVIEESTTSMLQFKAS